MLLLSLAFYVNSKQAKKSAKPPVSDARRRVIRRTFVAMGLLALLVTIALSAIARVWDGLLASSVLMVAFVGSVWLARKSI